MSDIKQPEPPADAPGSWGVVIARVKEQVAFTLARAREQLAAVEPHYNAAVKKVGELENLMRAVDNAYQQGRYVDGTDEEIPF